MEEHTQNLQEFGTKNIQQYTIQTLQKSSIHSKVALDSLVKLRKNDCSLKIRSLSSSDTGPFMFRIEIKHLDKFTYEKNKVSITVKGNFQISNLL